MSADGLGSFGSEARNACSSAIWANTPLCEPLLRAHQDHARTMPSLAAAMGSTPAVSPAGDVGGTGTRSSASLDRTPDAARQARARQSGATHFVLNDSEDDMIEDPGNGEEPDPSADKVHKIGNITERECLDNEFGLGGDLIGAKMRLLENEQMRLASQMSKLSMATQRLAADVQAGRGASAAEQCRGPATDWQQGLEADFERRCETFREQMDATAAQWRQDGNRNKVMLEDHSQRLAKLEAQLEQGVSGADVERFPSGSRQASTRPSFVAARSRARQSLGPAAFRATTADMKVCWTPSNESLVQSPDNSAASTGVCTPNQLKPRSGVRTENMTPKGMGFKRFTLYDSLGLSGEGSRRLQNLLPRPILEAPSTHSDGESSLASSSSSSSSNSGDGVEARASDAGGQIDIEKTMSDRQLRSLFHQCDRDSNGMISLAELVEAVRTNAEFAELFHLPRDVSENKESEKLMENLFATLDITGDNNVSWGELRSWYRRKIWLEDREKGKQVRMAASSPSSPATCQTTDRSRDSLALAPRRCSRLASTAAAPLRSASGLYRLQSLDHVFVFPMPTIHGHEEERAFRSRHLGKRSYRSLIENALVNPQSRANAELDCGKPLESLAGTVNCVIRLMVNLMNSIAESHHGTCEVFTFTSVERDALFVCIEFDDDLAETVATLHDYPLQLDLGCLDLLDIKITDLTDLEPAFVNYNPSMRDKGLLRMYEQPGEPHRVSVLRQVDRVRLTYDRITDHIDINELQRLGFISHAYPAHNLAALEQLKQRWANIRLLFQFGQPIDDVRDYFGEEIGFYFLFIETMNMGLVSLLPFAGLHFVFLALVGDGTLVKLVVTAVVMIWFTVVIKVWRRREAHYANKWGVDYKSAQLSVKDPINPRFKGRPMPNPLDENLSVLQADPTKMVMGRLLSFFACTIWVLIVMAGVVANRMWAVRLDRHGKPLYAKLMTLLLPMQIQFFDQIWDVLGNKLTDIEIHVHLHSQCRSKAVKTFVMKFIHWFNAFFYMAYVQPFVDPSSCQEDTNCEKLLRQNLVLVLLVYSGFAIADCLKPYVHMRYRVWKESREFKSHHDTDESYRVSFLEQQAKMDEYGGKELTTDFIQVIFPLAWIATFGTVMPTAALMAYVNLSVQQRADAWRLVAVYRRPFPLRSEGIGVWNDILEILNYLSIFNLLGLLAIHTDHIDRIIPSVFYFKSGALSNSYRMATFFFLQNIAVICKVVFGRVVEDVGPRTKLNRDRQELQRLRLFEFSKAEYDEDVDIQGDGDVHAAAFDQAPGLEPGDPRFLDPPSQSCGCNCSSPFTWFRKPASTKVTRKDSEP